jgi:hypothetical protein
MKHSHDSDLSLPPIQGLWIGDRLPRLGALSIQSFLKIGHPFHLFTYSKLQGIPHGTTVIDANEILPSELIYKPLCQFADWFRYTLLYRRGGWWSDLDVICLQPLNFSAECVFGWQDSELINNAIIHFPARHGVLRELSAIGYDPNALVEFDSHARLKEKKLRAYRFPELAEARVNISWAETAPVALTAAIKAFGMTKFARPQNEFYPVSWPNWEDLFNGKLTLEDPIFENARTIHLWNELLSRSDLAKSEAYDPSSIVQIFIDQLGKP